MPIPEVVASIRSPGRQSSAPRTCAGGSHPDASTPQVVASPSPGAAEQLAAQARHGAARPPTHSQFCVALLVDQLLVEDSAEAFERVEWGGGPACLLAAATQRHLYVFSLRNFMLAEAGRLVPTAGPPDPSGRPAGLMFPLPSTSYRLVYRSGLSHPLLAMDWAHAALALLYTDAGHNVVMLQVRCGWAGDRPSCP